MSDQENPETPAQVDWEAKYNELKAEARKWEDRSKSNFEELQKAQETATAFEARVAELETSNADLSETVSGFERAKERDALLKKVSETTGISADALRGDTEEELIAHAETLKSVFKPSAPVIEGQAKSPGGSPVDPEREFVKGLFGN